MPVSAQERANVITHATGIVASVAGTAGLIIWAALRGNAWDVVSVSIFGATLVLLYSASTAYHSAAAPVARTRLKVMDHCAIYLLIAGTYTPFMMGSLRGAWGWALFGVIWGLAAAGIVFKVFTTGRLKLLSTLVYVVMGWLIVMAIGPMLRHFEPVTLSWLLAGGVLYTAGTPFYHSTRVRHAHAVWHVFVMAGSVCHGLAVATSI